MILGLVAVAAAVVVVFGTARRGAELDPRSPVGFPSSGNSGVPSAASDTPPAGTGPVMAPDSGARESALTADTQPAPNPSAPDTTGPDSAPGPIHRDTPVGDPAELPRPPVTLPRPPSRPEPGTEGSAP